MGVEEQSNLGKGMQLPPLLSLSFLLSRRGILVSVSPKFEGATSWYSLLQWLNKSIRYFQFVIFSYAVKATPCAHACCCFYCYQIIVDPAGILFNL